MDNLNGAQYLLNQLEFCKNSLKVSCNDGAVHINVHTMNFTFVGKFGQMVNLHIIKNDVYNSPVNKLIILHTYMDLYSTKNGGFTLIPS